MFLTVSAASAAGNADKFSLDSIKALMEDLDPAALLPDIGSIVGVTELVCRIAILAGPLILLAMGIAYLLLAPKEANHYFGYRTFFGMGSVAAWRFTQRLAGVVLGLTGLGLTVIMLVMSLSLGSMDAMAMLWQTVYCLIWEAGFALAATLVINVVVLLSFDAKGDRRRKKDA